MQKKRTGLIFQSISVSGILLSLLSGFVYFVSPTPVLAAEMCRDVQVVFARGSGGTVDDENGEPRVFFDKLRNRISQPVTVGYYELGTGWSGYTDKDLLYPAEAVFGWGNFSVGLGAKATGGDGFLYGQSVSTGVNELVAFIGLSAAQCPDTKYVIGGYSQGAQVVGQALSSISDKAKNNVVFVALFGDPKLYLPEGKGLIDPPACRGAGFSNWRRDVPDCRTHEGSLGARSLYVPPGFKGRVGLWCNDRDWVCGSSMTPAFNYGHGEYTKENGAIDKAAQEIARRLKNTLPFPKNQYIDDRYLALSEGEARLNVAYIWSTNASSQSLYDQAKAKILAHAEKVWAEGGRFALTPVREDNDQLDYLNPTPSYVGSEGETKDGLFGINDRHQIDYRFNFFPLASPLITNHPKSILFAGYMTIDPIPWQLGATKAMIYVAESADFKYEGMYFYLPSKGSYVTVPEYMIRRALEIDPVNTYFVIGSDEDAQDAEYIANATGGKVVRYDPSRPETLDNAFMSVQQEIGERPTVVFGSEAYETYDGEPVVFDVSSSYTTSGEIVSFDWDYEGDGIWDETTANPHAAHRYPDGFSGIVHAKATDSNGRIGTMTATITSLPNEDRAELPIVEGIRYDIIETKDNISTVRILWDAVTEAPYLVLSVDGVHLGRITTDRTSIEITDIRRDQEVAIDLQAMDAEYYIGSRNGVVVPALPAYTPERLWGNFSVSPLMSGNQSNVDAALTGHINSTAASNRESSTSEKRPIVGLSGETDKNYPIAQLLVTGVVVLFLLIGSSFLLYRRQKKSVISCFLLFFVI